MNVLNFTGNAGRDAETRYTPNGDAITSFSVALTSGYGEKKLTTWINCSMFGKRGESVAQYIKKGTQVAVSGEFAARPYQTKEGVEKLSLECRVNDLTLLGSKDASTGTTQRQAKKPNEPKGDFDDFDDDIPF
jgi:single-strand DNA-binding protein